MSNQKTDTPSQQYTTYKVSVAVAYNDGTWEQLEVEVEQPPYEENYSCGLSGPEVYYGCIEEIAIRKVQIIIGDRKDISFIYVIACEVLE